MKFKHPYRFIHPSTVYQCFDDMQSAEKCTKCTHAKYQITVKIDIRYPVFSYVSRVIITRKRFFEMHLCSHLSKVEKQTQFCSYESEAFLCLSRKSNSCSLLGMYQRTMNIFCMILSVQRTSSSTLCSCLAQVVWFYVVHLPFATLLFYSVSSTIWSFKKLFCFHFYVN